MVLRGVLMLDLSLGDYIHRLGKVLPTTTCPIGFAISRIICCFAECYKICTAENVALTTVRNGVCYCSILGMTGGVTVKRAFKNAPSVSVARTRIWNGSVSVTEPWTMPNV